METISYKVTIGNICREYPKGTMYREIIREVLGEEESRKIILTYDNGKLRELFHGIKKDCTLTPVYILDNKGIDAYRRSVILLLYKAVSDIYGNECAMSLRVRAAFNGNYYCTIDDVLPDAVFTTKTLIRMRELVKDDIPIMKNNKRTKEVREMFKASGRHDKDRLFQNRLSSNTNYYELGGYVDYFYGYMSDRTGILTSFDLVSYKDCFVILLPEPGKSMDIPAFEPNDKFYDVFSESISRCNRLKVSNIGEMNSAVIDGRIRNIILCSEAIQEKNIGDIAASIIADPLRKVILIAGPSSSGKTSFANRLCIQLNIQGAVPHIISTDDYFIDRDKVPLDENGEQDLENLYAMDVELLNNNLNDLLNGCEIDMPTYNFKKGQREYLGNKLKLGKEDVLVVEGIHCLNDELTYAVSADKKYRIFVCPLSTINIDNNNILPVSDNRLLRRMSRDARTRGKSAQDTIREWPIVRRGEEKNIFPYQYNADVVFNSALIYELPVEKVYCERLLFSVPEDSPEYEEAKRLLKFLGYFIPVDNDDIPKNSIVREFIGDSIFNV